MKQLLSRIRKRNMGQPVLLRGHLIGQGVLWLATLCFTQLYGAEAYGTFALFLSLVNICGFLACLGFEIALLLPDDEVVADRLFAGCIIIVTFLTMLIRGLLYLLLLPNCFSIPIDWLMLAIWGQGILVIQHEWYTRHGDWKRLGGLWQAQYVLLAVMQGACFFYYPGNGLMVGYALTLGFLGGRFCCRHLDSFRIDRLLIHTLRSYWPVVCLDLGGRSVQILAQQLQPFFILPCFGPKKAAHFFLAQQLLGETPAGTDGRLSESLSAAVKRVGAAKGLACDQDGCPASRSTDGKSDTPVLVFADYRLDGWKFQIAARLARALAHFGRVTPLLPRENLLLARQRTGAPAPKNGLDLHF